MSEEGISPLLTSNSDPTYLSHLSRLINAHNNSSAPTPGSNTSPNNEARHLSSHSALPNQVPSVTLTKVKADNEHERIIAREREAAAAAAAATVAAAAANAAAAAAAAETQTPLEPSSQTQTAVGASVSTTGDREGPSSASVSTTDLEMSTSSSKKAFLMLGLVFVGCVIFLFWGYSTFPKMEPDEIKYLKLPRSIDDAKMLGTVLNRYKEKYYPNVLGGIFVVYIFLQTFAIPGSIFLSILSGFLFPFWLALILVCFCSATGASFCYGLSMLVGRRLIYKYFPQKVKAWSDIVEVHRDNLMNYMIFLRVTPFLPNWFINITSPVIGVPLFPFFLGTFLGVAPPSFIAIQAGTTLNQLTASSDAITWNSVFVLLILGGLSLLPVFLKDNLKRKFD